jgi:hypothetical protein
MVSIKKLSPLELAKFLDDPDNIENMPEDELDYALEALGLDVEGCLAHIERVINEKIRPSHDGISFFNNEKDGVKVLGYIDAKSRRGMTVAVVSQPASQTNDPLDAVRKMSMRDALKKIASEGQPPIFYNIKITARDGSDGLRHDDDRITRLMELEDRIPKIISQVKKQK